MKELENELAELDSENTLLLKTWSTEDDCNRMDKVDELIRVKKAQLEHAKEELRTAEREAERMREKAAKEARQKATAATTEELKQLCVAQEQLERQLEEHRKSMLEVSDAERMNYRAKFIRPLLLRKTEVSKKIFALEAQLKLSLKGEARQSEGVLCRPHCLHRAAPRARSSCACGRCDRSCGMCLGAWADLRATAQVKLHVEAACKKDLTEQKHFIKELITAWSHKWRQTSRSAISSSSFAVITVTKRSG